MWQRGVKGITHARADPATVDPWAARGLDTLRVEHCLRERYDARTQTWTTDDVLVKMVRCIW